MRHQAFPDCVGEEDPDVVMDIFPFEEKINKKFNTRDM